MIGKSLPAAADTTAEAKPGARELVELTAAAVPVAVASNSPRMLLEAALVRGGLSEMFPVKLAADQVSASKPIQRCIWPPARVAHDWPRR